MQGVHIRLIDNFIIHTPAQKSNGGDSDVVRSDALRIQRNDT